MPPAHLRTGGMIHWGDQALSGGWNMDRRTKWLLAASLIVAAGLLGPAVTVWRSTPAAIPLAAISMARAQVIARKRVHGGQMLVAAPTVRHNHPGYLFSFRQPTGTVVTIWVDGHSGQVVLASGRPGASSLPSSTPYGSTPTRRSQFLSPLSSNEVSAIAAHAVGGGQVIWIQRSETSDHGTWYYTAKVLLRNSSQAKVKISEFGHVLWVHTSSGN